MPKSLTALYRCFFDLDFLSHQVSQGQGRGLALVSWAAAIATVLFMLFIAYALPTQITPLVEDILSQMPNGEIRDGVLSIESTQDPYIIKSPEGDALVVIDTSPDLDTSKTDEYPVYISAKHIYVTFDKQQNITETYPLSKLGDSSFSPEALKDAWRSIIIQLFIAGPIMVFMGIWSKFFLLSLVVTLMSYIITSRYTSQKLDFDARMRLSASASVPLFLLDMCRTFLPQTVLPYGVYFLVPMASIYLVMEFMKRRKLS